MIVSTVVVALLSVLCRSITGVDASSLYPSVSATLEELSGTCRSATAGFDIGNYYNLDAVQKSNIRGGGGSFPAPGVDLANSSWDLARDGAYSGFRVMYCEFQDFPGNTPTSVLNLVAQKGITVVSSCDTTQLLVRDASTQMLRYSVLIVADSALLEGLTTSDAQSIATYYENGGGLYLLSGGCPSTKNINKILSALPSPISGTALTNTNTMYPSRSLTRGDPRVVNQFGFHVAFTGVDVMTTGQTGAVPIAAGTAAVTPAVASGGIFASLTTHPLVTGTACSTSDPQSFSTTSFPGAFYLDPLEQLASLPEARRYGRIVVDTALSRYRGQDDTRTGSRRFGANIVTWLMDIEGKWASSSSSSTGGGGVDASQIVACSSGDAFRVKAIGATCHIDFYPTDSGTPRCISTVVTAEQGTTCQIGINALYGSYWILMNGLNTSLRLVQTANLFTRVELLSGTGSCRPMGTANTNLYNCTAGSSIQTAWNLPSPTRNGYLSQGGPGKPLVNCTDLLISSLSSGGRSGVNVTCVLGDTSRVPRGYAQLFFDDVSTGLSVFIENPQIPNGNVFFCSGSQTKSRSKSVELTLTETTTVTTTATSSASCSATRATATHDWTSSMTLTDAETLTLTRTAETVSTTRGAMTSTETNTVTVRTVTKSATGAQRSATTTGTYSANITTTKTLSMSRPSRTRPSTSQSLTRSGTFGCVDVADLSAALAAYAQRPPTAQLGELDVQMGNNVSNRGGEVDDGSMGTPAMTTFVLYRIPNLERNALHIPWFQPHRCPIRVLPLIATNQGGFMTRTGKLAGIEAHFVQGLGSSSTLPPLTTKDGVVTLTMPSLPVYHIFEAEVVDLAIPASCATLSFLCNATYNNVTMRFNESVESIHLLRIVVAPNDPTARQSVLDTLQPLILLAGLTTAPHAVGHLQAMMMHSISPCGTAFLRTNLAVDILSILVPTYRIGWLLTAGNGGGTGGVDSGDDGIDRDVFGSLVYGALWWLVIVGAVQVMAVGVVSCFGRVSGYRARELCWMPSLWLQCGFHYVFPAAVFASLQRIALYATGRAPAALATTTSAISKISALRMHGGDESDDGQRTAFAFAVLLTVFCVVVVPSILWYKLHRRKSQQSDNEWDSEGDGDADVSEKHGAMVHAQRSHKSRGRAVPLSSIIPAQQDDDGGGVAAVGPLISSDASSSLSEQIFMGDHPWCLTFSLFEYTTEHQAHHAKSSTSYGQSGDDGNNHLSQLLSASLLDGEAVYEGVEGAEGQSYEEMLFGRHHQSRNNGSYLLGHTDGSHDERHESLRRSVNARDASWRHGDNAPWGVRWLSQALILPKGTWGPPHRRATIGHFLSNRFARPERYWWALEYLTTPLLLSILLATSHASIAFPSDSGPIVLLGELVASASTCHGVLAAASVLYIARVVVRQLAMPLRTGMDHGIAQVGDALQVVYFVLTSIQFSTATSIALEALIVTVAVLQVLLCFITFVWCVVLEWWILPGVTKRVAQRLLFAWTNLPKETNRSGGGDRERTPSPLAQEQEEGARTSRNKTRNNIHEEEEDDAVLHEVGVRAFDQWSPEEFESGDFYIRSRRDEAALQEMKALGVLSLVQSTP